MEDENIQKEATDSTIYEVGFHILPSIVDEKVAEEFDLIKKAVEGSDGKVISLGQPIKFDLAYPISKEVDGEKKTFDQSYFGWVKFEIGSDNIEGLKKDIEARSLILRSLIVKTIREETFVPRETPPEREQRESYRGKKARVAQVVEEPKELTAEDKKAIDESIEELVSEE